MRHPVTLLPHCPSSATVSPSCHSDIFATLSPKSHTVPFLQLVFFLGFVFFALLILPHPPFPAHLTEGSSAHFSSNSSQDCCCSNMSDGSNMMCQQHLGCRMKHYDQEQLDDLICLRHSLETQQTVCANNIKLIDRHIRTIKRRQQLRISGKKYRTKKAI